MDVEMLKMPTPLHRGGAGLRSLRDVHRPDIDDDELPTATAIERMPLPPNGMNVGFFIDFCELI